MTALGEQLASGAAALGVTLTPLQSEQLLRLGEELLAWNLNVNLTSISTPDRVVSHHLLDSLSAHGELVGTTVADVGTGGGFPGLPLAILDPQRQFTLIDAVAKKLRFVDHAARLLGLANVTTQHARVEQLAVARPFDTVVTRAFSALPQLLAWVSPLCGPDTRVIAMKGQWPPAPGTDDGKPLPRGWVIEQVTAVTVPGVATPRHLVRCRAAGRPRG